MWRKPLPRVVLRRKANITDKMTDFFGAYAADLRSLQRLLCPNPGQLRFRAKGGAIWRAAIRMPQNFDLVAAGTRWQVLGG